MTNVITWCTSVYILPYSKRVTTLNVLPSPHFALCQESLHILHGSIPHLPCCKNYDHVLHESVHILPTARMNCILNDGVNNSPCSKKECAIYMHVITFCKKVPQRNNQHFT